MKKVIGYIISLTTIFLLVILLTLPTVNVAIAANDSSILEVNVYSADKIKTVKLLAQDAIASSKCSQYTIPRNCSFSTDDEAQKALMKYKRAVSECQNGRGTEEAVENAWRKLRIRCLDTMKGPLLEDFEFP